MKRPATRPAVPSKDDILAFIGGQSGKVGIREIARAFGTKNADRVELKRLLRELADEGRLERRRKKLHQPEALPQMVIADIIGRDQDGDLVAVPSEWEEAVRGAAPRIAVVLPPRTRPGEAPGIGDRALMRVSETGDNAIPYSGRVVKLIERAKKRVLGIFRALPGGGGRLLPVDKKELGRELSIAPGAGGGARDGELVAVETQGQRGYGSRAAARVKERLGAMTTERAASMIAIHAYEIPHIFPQAAEQEAAAAVPATLSGREDWRKLALVTIDPADAKDHDDAVHTMADPDPGNRDGHILTVAIADVAHYVTPGSALDRAALERGNSIYFPDRVVPMLPERISNDLCSLKPREDRPALAVRMVIGADGRKRAHSFHRVLMRSVAKLDYVQAQSTADGRPDSHTKPLRDDVIEPLYAAYRSLRQARALRAPLDLELPERKIMLKPDGSVDCVVTAERLDSHKLIEEFMILANVAAAETLERARVPLIYRVHDEPDGERVNALRELLQSLDIRLPGDGTPRPAQFNRILARVRGRDVEKLVNEVVLRSQAQAEYAAENYGHFGLNLRRYAHFTSPIRRYADLVVHRALIRAFALGDGALPAQEDAGSLAEVAARISAAERRAMKAERETTDRLIAHFLADRVGATFEGHVSGVTRAGLFVKLDETGADGFIPARSIGQEYYRYQENRHALVGDRSGRSHRLGDRVSVRLVEAAPLAGALRFELVAEARDGGERHRRLQTGNPGGRARNSSHRAAATRRRRRQ